LAYVPTVEVEGKAGRVVVNQADVQSWIDDGYKVVEGSEKAGIAPGTNADGEVVAADSVDSADADAGSDDALTRDDVDGMKAADLAKVVADKGLSVDLSELKKIGDKRDAVADALGL
jgi:hypothetical protein